MTLQNTWLRKPRKPFGEDKRKQVLWEKAFSVTFEATLQAHGVSFWHCTLAQASQPGWPDYVLLGKNWLAFIELKARNQETGRRGKISGEQMRWQREIQEAGGTYRVFLLPDEWHEVDVFLNERTGKEIWGQ